jgi:hypothetical protein
MILPSAVVAPATFQSGQRSFSASAPYWRRSANWSSWVRYRWIQFTLHRLDVGQSGAFGKVRVEVPDVLLDGRRLRSVILTFGCPPGMSRKSS